MEWHDDGQAQVDLLNWTAVLQFCCRPCSVQCHQTASAPPPPPLTVLTSNVETQPWVEVGTTLATPTPWSCPTKQTSSHQMARYIFLKGLKQSTSERIQTLSKFKDILRPFEDALKDLENVNHWNSMNVSVGSRFYFKFIYCKNDVNCTGHYWQLHYQYEIHRGRSGVSWTPGKVMPGGPNQRRLILMKCRACASSSILCLCFLLQLELNHPGFASNKALIIFSLLICQHFWPKCWVIIDNGDSHHI